MRVPYDSDESADQSAPCTTATALQAGWCWDIRLQKRRGTGYVYSSAHLSPEEAKRELRRVQKVPDTVPARHIPFRSGRVDRPWIGNVVAIGLAAGFLEPLESTGLYPVEEGTNLLIDLFPQGARTDRLAALYNCRIAERYDECLAFINLHYCQTERRDTPFWRQVARPEHICPSLAEMLDM